MVHAHFTRPLWDTLDLKKHVPWVWECFVTTFPLSFTHVIFAEYLLALSLRAEAYCRSLLKRLFLNLIGRIPRRNDHRAHGNLLVRWLRVSSITFLSQTTEGLLVSLFHRIIHACLSHEFFNQFHTILCYPPWASIIKFFVFCSHIRARTPKIIHVWNPWEDAA